MSFSEPFGLYLQAWTYGSTTTLPALPTGVKLESYLYVILCTISVSSMVIIYTAYEDMKIKYLLLQGFKDLFHVNMHCGKSRYCPIGLDTTNIMCYTVSSQVEIFQ